MLLNKRLFICFSFLLLISTNTSSAQPKLLKHPYLIFTSNRVADLKQRIATDTFIDNHWKQIVAEADAVLEKSDAKLRLEQLSIVYAVTQKEVYAKKIKETLIKLCTMPAWSYDEMVARKPVWHSDLRSAHNCWLVAVAYDVVYDYLTKDEKYTIANGLTELGIKPALGDWLFPETRIHALNSMGHNWWSSCVGMAGIAALSVVNEIPQAANWADEVSAGLEEWFKFSGDVLQNKPRTFDKNGSMYESVGYANFGTTQFLLFRLAYCTAFPNQKMPEVNGVEKNADWFAHVAYPKEQELWSLNFGDGSPFTSAESVMKLLIALGNKNANLLWYINQVKTKQHHEGWPSNSPLGLLFLPDLKKAPDVPVLPTTAIFKDMNWAVMRNSWRKNETMLGVKSGYTWNHSHADANSFILFHKGEAIIKDAGNSAYSTKEYPAYFFQSEAHNVVMFNGKAQPKEQQYCGSPINGQLSGLIETSNFKYVLANGVGPTAANFSRNFRHFIWLDKMILIIDDVKAHETGKFSWRLHPGGEAKKVQGDISIVQNKSAVLVRPLFPETLVQGGFDHDFPENLKLVEITAPKARDAKNPTETHYSIEYPLETKQTKFITAILLKDSVTDKGLPTIERLQAVDMNGLKITYKGKVTELYLNLLADGHLMHRNSVNSFHGFETDAYLTAFSYPEKDKEPTLQNISDYFMVYGSFLRKDTFNVFSALSKVNMVCTKKDNQLDLVIKGQPVINAFVGSLNKPSLLTVNSKSVQPLWRAQQKQIVIRVLDEEAK
jgi:oligo-alginate lyase